MRPAGFAPTVIVVQPISERETVNPQLSAIGAQAHLDDLLRATRVPRSTEVRAGKLAGRLPRRAVLVAAAVVLAVGAVSAPAGAVTGGSWGAGGAGTGKPAALPGRVPASLARWAPLYAMQNRLDAAARAILAAGGAGNASVVVSPVSGELHIYWHGPVPARVRALARRLGVRVRFAAAAFPLSTLVAQARRLAADPRVAEAAPRADGGGVSVTLAGTVTRAGRAAAQRELRARSPVALTFATGPRPQPTYGRQADIPSFWGGSWYVTSTSDGCTNGFALSVPASPSNVFELSAGHCGDWFENVTIPGQPDPAGQVVWKDQCRDTLIIKYPAGVGPDIYTGAFNSSSATVVRGAAPDFVGDWIADGGAASGEHFNNPVWATDVFMALPGNSCSVVGPLTEAKSFDLHGCVAAPGDSGGPVYTYNFDWSVTARGTISAATLGTADCPGVNSWGSSTVFYAPLLRPDGDPATGVLQYYDANLWAGTTILSG
jgi:hypothetical protein